MNQHTFSRRSLIHRGLAVAALGSVLLAAVPSQAAKKAKPSAGIEPWKGRRVLLLLPLQLGEGFNADRTFGQAILSRAESLLQIQLQNTGKFSVVQAHRFSPLIQRGLQEKRLTEAQVTAFLGEAPAPGSPTGTPGTPSLENANTILSQFVFDRPAMIADFRLEEVRAGGDAARPSVQVQVSGRLYEAGSTVAIKSPVVTGEPARTGQNNIERFLASADNAFMQAALEMVAPIEDIQLPSANPVPVVPAVPGTPDSAATPPVAPTTPAAPTNPVTLPGDTPIAGASSASATGVVPQLPAARPPLGITVPNATTVR